MYARCCVWFYIQLYICIQIFGPITCAHTFWALKIYRFCWDVFFVLFLFLICNIAFCEDGTKDINTGGSVFAFGFDYICGSMIVAVRSSKIATFCCILSSLLCFDNWIQYINSADKYKIGKRESERKKRNETQVIIT